IGAFDGVHLGHQQIFKQLIQHAQKTGGHTVVITFDPHPQQLLNPNSDFFLIQSLEDNIELIRQQGIDYLIIIPFTMEFSQLSTQEFIEEILVNRIGAKGIVMGPNHFLGKNREGNHQIITDLCEKNNIEIVEIPEFVMNENSVRSRKIRNHILHQEIDKAIILLGHDWVVKK
ncbi:MAG: FAD synthetase family protein, partial [Bacteroidales bacterium]